MKPFFDNQIKPLSRELDKTLNIKHIEIKYQPSELIARFRYKRVKDGKFTHGLQFDPMGDLAQ